MKIGKYRNSQWLTKHDVESMDEKQRQTRVVEITEETVGDDTKPVIYFAGIRKGWPCNISALNALAEMTGSDDTDDFNGQKLEVFVDPDVTYAGKRIGGIRLRPLRNDPPADFDDEIPGF